MELTGVATLLCRPFEAEATSEKLVPSDGLLGMIETMVPEGKTFDGWRDTWVFEGGL